MIVYKLEPSLMAEVLKYLDALYQVSTMHNP